MFDLSTLPAEVLNARGAYATVRAAHEDKKKELQVFCGGLQSIAAQVLRKMQPDGDAVPGSVELLISSARELLSQMEACSSEIESLARQKAELKPIAWSKQ